MLIVSGNSIVNLSSNCVFPPSHFIIGFGVIISTYPELKNSFQPVDVRFTKVLTKYSTEYNNQLFIYNLCQQLDMDKKDLISFFQEIRLVYGRGFFNNTEALNVVEKMFEETNISRLDIKRMYRFLDKNQKPQDVTITLDEDDDDF